MADVESLELQIKGNASGATRSLNTLIKTLEKLEEVTESGCGLSAVTKELKKLQNVNIGLNSSNTASAKSFRLLSAKSLLAGFSLERAGKTIKSWIDESSNYVENLNLFTVSMGEYAAAATVYANEVSAAMGIDPSEWMRNQGVFMTLASGFGIVGERANLMSEQLTQLGYDISSYYNISVAEAMSKVKSGLAGELEPLRAIGWDLSQAKLQAIALEKGITKSVNEMTQAEKAQLRYYAIMTQVTQVHGDMAETLDAPANQMRIFTAQVTQAARALGNIFIPLLNKLLPYAIAAAKVVRYLADAIASLVGYELPEMDDSRLSNVAASASEASDYLDEATDNAKKFKKTLLGIDELNVLPDTSSSSSDAGGGWVDFELPTYDFLGEATTARVDGIVDKMKEWLGITGEIDSWSDLLSTRFGHILTTVGLIGGALLAWKVGSDIFAFVNTISNLTQKLGFGNKGVSAASGDAIGEAAENIGKANGKLVSLVKNLGLGIAIIAEVAAAAIIFVGAIAVLGWELDQVRIAWEPVIANAGTVAIAMGVGTVLLAGVGAATAALGTLGGAMCGQIAIGIAVLAELGVATGLFIIEIWAIGKGLDEIGKAWDPVLDNGEDIAKAIGIGTGLLVGIGVVTAALGVATVATAGLLPVAIALGTGLLGELAWAFIDFTNNLVKVGNQLKDELHPCLADVKKILPPLTTNMEEYTSFMTGFADKVVEFTKASAITGFASAIDKVVGFFTGDPIKRLSKEVKDQGDKMSTLVERLTEVNPIIKDADRLMNEFNGAMAGLKAATGIDGNSPGTIGYTISVGVKLAKSGWTSVKKWLGDLDFKLNFTMPNIKVNWSSKTKNGFTIDYPSSFSTYARGGFPTEGEMFIAREAGPELVGSIGNRSAVVNNDQIVSAVSQGVYQAVVQAMSQAGGDQTVEAKVNDKVLFEVVVNRARQETVRRGYNPLLGGV